MIYSMTDDTIKECFKQVDDISSTIEGMESSADYLDVILSRIGEE